MKLSSEAIALMLAAASGMTAAISPQVISGPKQWADAMAYAGVFDGKPVIAVGGHHASSPSHMIVLNSTDLSEESRDVIPGSGSWYGSSITTGAVTGNSDTCVIVGAWGSIGGVTNGGSLSFFLLGSDGNPGTSPPDLFISGPNDMNTTANDRWAYSLDTFDVDGDGVTDVLVGAHGNSEFGATNDGYISLLFMKEKNETEAPEVDHVVKIGANDIGVNPPLGPDDGFAQSIASMGDKVFAIGAKNKIFLVDIDAAGAPTLLKEILASDVDAHLPTGVTVGLSQGFAYDVAGAHIVDEHPQLLVGVSGYDSNKGAVVVLFFNSDWSIKSAKLIETDPSWGSVAIRCGSSVAVLDHFDADDNLFVEIAIGCSSGSGPPSHVVILDDDYIYVDSDGDGYSDFVEETECSDPNDPSSVPTALSRTVCRVKKIQEEAVKVLDQVVINQEELLNLSTTADAIEAKVDAIAMNVGANEGKIDDMMDLVQEIHDNTKIKDKPKKRRFLRGGA